MTQSFHRQLLANDIWVVWWILWGRGRRRRDRGGGGGGGGSLSGPSLLRHSLSSDSSQVRFNALQAHPHHHHQGHPWPAWPLPRCPKEDASPIPKLTGSLTKSNTMISVPYFFYKNVWCVQASMHLAAARRVVMRSQSFCKVCKLVRFESFSSKILFTYKSCARKVMCHICQPWTPQDLPEHRWNFPPRTKWRVPGKITMKNHIQ